MCKYRKGNQSEHLNFKLSCISRQNWGRFTINIFNKRVVLILISYMMTLFRFAVQRHVTRTYHGYVDGELHPYPHTDDQDHRRDSAQTDVGQTHKPE